MLRMHYPPCRLLTMTEIEEEDSGESLSRRVCEVLFDDNGQLGL